ncbi:MAG: guanylate kinase [Anaerovoracaceae bacterium]|nr:guanylate kinase [Bacillota bacterium]MDY2671314.1 guanylate kinase [Anaerovoracaceae bacterium]
MKKGRLFVVSGPSGVGKGTIIEQITARLGDSVMLSVSATTRDPRPGDVDGVNYYFLTEEEFVSRVSAGRFLEHAYVHGHYYGTPLDPVEAAVEAGRDVILEIDVQGAMKVKETYGEGVYIFILPPSIKILRERLSGRGTETAEVVDQRMGKAMGEIGYLDRYDYGVVNDDLDRAVEQVLDIIKAEHCRVMDGEAEQIISEYREEK